MENQLSTIVKESGLEKTKAQVLLDNFSRYFQLAADWEKKAKTIVVTDESQIAEMKMARTGRLFLRQKRIVIEKTRKELKEQALREGKAIDGIANILKALIIPIEEYLEKQEKFIEIKIAEEAKRKRIEAEKKAEEERIAKEKAEIEEQKRIREENERLRKEAEEKEKELARERARVEAEKAKAEAERKKKETERIAYEKKVQEEKAEAERKAQAERERQAKIIAEQKAKAEAERRTYEEKIKREKEEAERRAQEERERQEKIIEAQKQKARKAEAEKAAYEASMIKCPFCHKSFSLKMIQNGSREQRL